MKTFIKVILGISLLVVMTHVSGQQTGNSAQSTTVSSVSIQYAPEFRILVQSLATEYEKQHEGVTIDVSEIASGPGGALRIQSGTISGNEYAWSMVLGRQAIVPVINAQNPLIRSLTDKGLSSAELAKCLKTPNTAVWGQLDGSGNQSPIHFCLLDEPESKNSVARFARMDVPEMKLVKMTADKLITTVRSDRFALGFCRLSDILDNKELHYSEGLTILPVDKNGNGKIDVFENIYSSPETFLRGVWIGKYPGTLSSEISIVAEKRPTDPETIGFISFILEDGQEQVSSNGYLTLASNEVKENLAMLSNLPALETENKGKAGIWLIVISLILITGVAVTLVFRSRRRQNAFPELRDIHMASALNADVLRSMPGLYYDKTHTWAFREKDGNVRIGIDDFLPHVTGRLTKIKMKQSGDKVSRGEQIMTIIHDGKQLNVYSPLSGTIREYNSLLQQDASLLNSSPFSEGWVYTLEPRNWSREMQFLFPGDRYKDWLTEELSRLRDFFTNSVRKNSAVYAQVILQDGGELTDQLLSELGPEVWEDFQTHFMDVSR